MNLQAGLVAYLEGQLHGGALEEGNQTYPGYLVLVTSGVGLLLTSKAKDAGLLNHAYAGILNSIYTAKLALLILPQVNPCCISFATVVLFLVNNVQKQRSQSIDVCRFALVFALTSQPIH